MNYIEPTAPAYRFYDDFLTEIHLPEHLSAVNLMGIENQESLVRANIELLLQDKPALNMLLWGEKGGGKSTLVRLLARDYASKALRVIEYCDEGYYGIYSLYNYMRAASNYYFLLYFDDVSFNENDTKYRNFKSIVEGGLETKPSNALFVATSNRRHLVADRASDTEDIHSRDDANELSSLYARFGLSIGFYPLQKELYLEIALRYMQKAGVSSFNGWEKEAESFAMARGGRSGRVASQFATMKLIELEAHK